MPVKSKFRLKTIRRETSSIAECYASPDLFVDWDKASKAAKNEFEVNGPIPCEGGGLPGFWCEGCRFGGLLPPEDV